MILSVEPKSALVDDDVKIVIEGLRGHQEITLVATLEEKPRMASCAHYRADSNGRIDVTKMPSLGGTYEGVESMGFIWSMRLTPEEKPGARLLKRDVCTPMKVTVSVYDGHIDVFERQEINQSTIECLGTQTIERWYLKSDVQRIDVREGRLIATLFVPKGDGPFPGVLDLFGTIGGLVEYRASLLASRGFVTLSLAYYWPNEKLVSDLEYYEEAVELLWRHPKVLKTGIGIIGVSKGAQLASLIAVISHKVRVVVSINGAPLTLLVDHTYHGETFKHLPMTSFSTFEFVPDLEEVFVPLERSVAKYLLIHGSDDNACPPYTMDMARQRLRTHGREADCQGVLYEDAGHLIEPPHSPHCRTSFHKSMGVMFNWGGTTKAHARAQEDSWRRIQHFLHTELTSLPEQQCSKL